MRNDSRITSTNDDGFRRLEVITGVGRRRRWTDEEKAWIVAGSLDPVTSVSAVARRYGLHPSRLFVWRQQFAAAAVRDAPGFVPVLVTEDGTAPAEPGGRAVQLAVAGRGRGPPERRPARDAARGLAVAASAAASGAAAEHGLLSGKAGFPAWWPIEWRHGAGVG